MCITRFHDDSLRVSNRWYLTHYNVYSFGLRCCVEGSFLRDVFVMTHLELVVSGIWYVHDTSRVLHDGVKGSLIRDVFVMTHLELVIGAV